MEPPDLVVDTPSIGAVLARFGNFAEPSSSIPNEDIQYNAVVSTCSVISKWQPVDLFISPVSDLLFHSSTINNVIHGVSEGLTIAGNVIRLDLDWVGSVIAPNTTLAPLAEKLIGSAVIEKLSDFAPISVSMLITSALSRIDAEIADSVTEKHIRRSIWFSGKFSSNEYDAGDWTELHGTVIRNGYGYSVQGHTRRLAVGILVTYILIVVIHMVLALRSG